VLDKIDKVAPYVALALLGYLCHSVMPSAAVSKAQGKDNPLISEEILRPALVTPEAHASPITRDPFDVRWASYKEEALASGKSQAPAEASATSAPAYSLDEEDGPPPLPSGLKGILLADTTQFVVVGDKICKPGDVIPGAPPNRSWVVERVEVDGVVLRFGTITRKVQLTSTERPGDTPPADPSEEGEP
jgi:hypothetical protein